MIPVLETLVTGNLLVELVKHQIMVAIGVNRVVLERMALQISASTKTVSEVLTGSISYGRCCRFNMWAASSQSFALHKPYHKN